MAWFSWSKTAATNATADSTINWQEGQAPSTINDSARAMMARSAEWRDDISGTITTGGTSTAYTITSNQVFTTLALMNGAMIAFVPHTTCGATVTLNVDGLGAKPLRTSPSVEVLAGMLIQGTPYVATYNNSDAVFYLRGFYPLPYAVPVGMMAPYVVATVPNSNFALPCGQAISRTTYATLFALTGTTYGVGDGSTTFGIPDLRGRAVFGQDGIGGFGTTGRITVAGGNFNGTTLGATGGAENHILTIAEMPAHTHPIHWTSPTIQSGASLLGVNAINSGGSFGGVSDSTGGDGAHTSMPPAIVLPFILRVI